MFTQAFACTAMAVLSTVGNSNATQSATVGRDVTPPRVSTGACACDANVVQPEQGHTDILDWGALLGCAFSNDCSACAVSCDVNCDGVVDSDDVGAVWCRSVMGGSLGTQCCTDPIGTCINGTTAQGQQIDCTWTTAAGCALNNGTFSLNYTCQTGACNTVTGCTVMSQAECAGMSGIFQGVGSTCAPQSFGACITPSGCTSTSAQSCAAVGGTFSGPGTSCQRGACLTEYDCGEAGTPQACELVGGSFQGPGTTCHPCNAASDCPSGQKCSNANECILRAVAIPTVSAWGIVTMSIVLLTVAKIKFNRR